MSSTVVILIVSGILFYTGQGFFNKLYSLTHPGKAAAAAKMFNIIYGMTVAIATLLYNRIRLSPDAFTLLIGAVNGFALFFYNYSAIHAAQSGPYTLQSMMSSFGNIIIPLAVSLTVWNDRLSILSWLGVGCMLLAFLLYNANGLGDKRVYSNKYIWFLPVFLMNGIYSTINAAHARIEGGGHHNDFIIITFLTAATISAANLLISRDNETRRAFHMPARALVFALTSSICAAAAINMLMLTLHFVPSSILYPIESGGILILSAILSRLILKERLTLLQIVGIGVAVLGLVLTNL